MIWKPIIIEMTQYEEARRDKADATFFPPVSDSALDKWQDNHEVVLPEPWLEFYLQSNGMEAKKGQWFPVLPIEECDVWAASCRLEAPWVGFGKIGEVKFYLNTAIEGSVYRLLEFQQEPEFFCTGLNNYFGKVFQGRAEK